MVFLSRRIKRMTFVFIFSLTLLLTFFFIRASWGDVNENRPYQRANRGFISLCNWPKPYSLSQIAPEFRAYLQNGTSSNFTIASDNDVSIFVAKLESLGYLRANRPVIFVVHGFRDEITAGYVTDIKDSLLALGDYAIFLLGWEKGAYLSPWRYTQAASNIQTVGAVVASTAEAILKTNIFHGNSSLLYLYCIGHSLGAHVCGYAGLKDSGLFDRITGIDPAGPGFEDCPSNPSLRLENADCVDAIHSDGDSTDHIFPHQGSLKRWGLVDFYPNGGVSQPGCSLYDNDFHACSHHRSAGLFISTVRQAKGACTADGPCKGVALSLPDKSCRNGGYRQQMGFYSSCHWDVPSSERRGGMFYLTTTASEPYC